MVFARSGRARERFTSRSSRARARLTALAPAQGPYDRLLVGPRRVQGIDSALAALEGIMRKSGNRLFAESGRNRRIIEALAIRTLVDAVRAVSACVS